MNGLRSFRTKYKLKSHVNACKNHNYCNIKRPEPRNKILKFAQNHKSMKIPFAIYADIASLLEKNISV